MLPFFIEKIAAKLFSQKIGKHPGREPRPLERDEKKKIFEKKFIENRKTSKMGAKTYREARKSPLGKRGITVNDRTIF